MSFINHYLDKHRLDQMSNKHKYDVKVLEQKLESRMKGNNQEIDFENDILTEYGPQIADLVERASKALHGKFSFSKFRVALNIGIEIYQLVDQMSDKVVPPGYPEDKAHECKVEFGKDLTFFVWKTIDPLAEYLTWLPFKSSIERGLVRWLAGYAVDVALDLLAAQNKTVTSMSVSSIGLKTLP